MLLIGLLIDLFFCHRTDVKRRPNRSLRPRPMSMIEATTRSKESLYNRPAGADSRRRNANTQPVMSGGRLPTVQEPGPMSATQRRLAYSRSLRERRTQPRPTLTLPRRAPSLRESSSWSTDLVYTAFRNTKHTANSRSADNEHAK